MFSKSSFNALLKTLEEPPPHVKFLLATTDPQKLPVTILSRCLQFNLKRLPVSLIISHLQHILTEEGVEHNVTALQLIAEAADGSMRDALSLLDQALAFGGGAIREQEVRDMLGSVSRDKVIRLLQAILQRDAALTLQVVAELAELSPDFESVLAELLSLLHHTSLAKTVPEALDEFVSARETLLEICEQVSAEDLQLFYQIALIGRKDLPLSPDARAGFEMIMLRMLAFRPMAAGTERPSTTTTQQSTRASADSKPAVSRPGASKQEAGNSATGAAAARQAIKSSATAVEKTLPEKSMPEKTMSEKPLSKPKTEKKLAATADVESPVIQSSAAPSSAAQSTEAATSVGQKPAADWRQVVESLGLGGLVKQLAVNCTVKHHDGNNIVLQIAGGHSNLINPKAKLRLQQALGEYFDIEAHLDIEVVSQTETESPAQTVQREALQRQDQAEQAINEDSFVQSLKDNFNAEVVPGSVKPVT